MKTLVLLRIKIIRRVSLSLRIQRATLYSAAFWIMRSLKKVLMRILETTSLNSLLMKRIVRTQTMRLIIIVMYLSLVQIMSLKQFCMVDSTLLKLCTWCLSVQLIHSSISLTWMQILMMKSRLFLSLSLQHLLL